jgi:hypothetical protein
MFSLSLPEKSSATAACVKAAAKVLSLQERCSRKVERRAVTEASLTPNLSPSRVEGGKHAKQKDYPNV